MTDVKTPAMFKWGDQEINPADIPTHNLFALTQQGLNHKRGNEVSAARVAWLKSEEGAQATEEDVTKWVAAKQAEMLEKILHGALGVRVSAGPRVSGIDALKRTIAVERIKAAFKSHSAKTGKKLSLPTGDETIDYMGKAMTREDLIAAMLNKQATAIEAEAKRRQSFQQEGAEVGEDLF